MSQRQDAWYKALDAFSRKSLPTRYPEARDNKDMVAFVLALSTLNNSSLTVTQIQAIQTIVCATANIVLGPDYGLTGNRPDQK